MLKVTHIKPQPKPEAPPMPLGSVIQYANDDPTVLPSGFMKGGRMLNQEEYKEIYELLTASCHCQTITIGKRKYFKLPDFGTTQMMVGGPTIYTIIKVK